MSATEWFFDMADALIAYEDQEEKIAEELKRLDREYAMFSETEASEVQGLMEKSFSKMQIVYIDSILLKETGQKRYLDNAIAILMETIDSPDIAAAFYYNFSCTLSNWNHINCYEAMLKFKRWCTDICFRKYQIEGEYIPVKKRNINRVVIITEQMLDIKHAPTRLIFQMAYTFKKRLNKEVLVISVPSAYVLSEGWRRAKYSHADPRFYGCKWEREWNGELFTGYQLAYGADSDKSYTLLAEYIREWNPLFILHAGVLNPYAEVFNRFTTGVSMPFGAVMPVSDSMLFAIEQSSKESGSYHGFLESGASAQRIVIQDHVKQYFPKSNDKCLRGEFGIEDDVFLIAIVGNRLESEIDECFIDLLKRIISIDQKIRISIVCGAKNIIKNKFSDEIFDGRVYETGFCDDLMRFYQIVDLYLNPFRNGGGFSAYMALSAGVPVLSLNRGDVAVNAGADFCVPDSDSMYEWVNKYLNDKTFVIRVSGYIEKFNKANSEEVFWQGMEKNMQKIINAVTNASED